MRRAQDQSGAQAPQQATGNVTGTSGNVTGATSTSLRDQPATRTESSTTYARSTGPSAGSRHASGGGGVTDFSSVGRGGSLAMLAGLVTFLAGLAGVIKSSFYHVVSGYAYHWTSYGWGITLLVLGVLLFAAGAVHLLGMSFGKYIGAFLAVLTAIAGFLWLPYSPIWGIIVVALSALAIWGLLSRGGGADADGGYGAGSSGRYGEASTGTNSGMSSGTTTTSSSMGGTTRSARR